jgi:hypothetical protein
MTVASPLVASPDRIARRYLRAPVPLYFPSSAEMPETQRHLLLRTALFEIVWGAFGDSATVGSDQFIFWDPTDPRQCCAPDLFVRLGTRVVLFDSWKVWERGAPELAVEIGSRSDAPELPWEAKLERFRRLGVRELVRFEPLQRDLRVRIWDGLEGDLVERDAADPAFARCDTLSAYWCVRDDTTRGPMLRLARDAEGLDLYPTPEEARQREAEARQREAEARQREAEARQREVDARQHDAEALRREAQARHEAERRVAELEAELAKRRP